MQACVWVCRLHELKIPKFGFAEISTTNATARSSHVCFAVFVSYILVAANSMLHTSWHLSRRNKCSHSTCFFCFSIIFIFFGRVCGISTMMRCRDRNFNFHAHCVWCATDGVDCSNVRPRFEKREPDTARVKWISAFGEIQLPDFHTVIDAELREKNRERGMEWTSQFSATTIKPFNHFVCAAFCGAICLPTQFEFTPQCLSTCE